MKNTISTQLKPVEIFFYGDNRNRLKIIAISIQGADDKQMFNTNFYITHLNTYLPNNFLHIAAYHHNLEPIKHFKIR